MLMNILILDKFIIFDKDPIYKLGEDAIYFLILEFLNEI